MKRNEIYCVKCRKPVVPSNPSMSVDVRGRPRIKANCPNCKTKVFRYV